MTVLKRAGILSDYIFTGNAYVVSTCLRYGNYHIYNDIIIVIIRMMLNIRLRANDRDW